MDGVKGKFNKLKVGQKVKAKPELVDWYSSHLSWGYGVPVDGDRSYGENGREIPLKDLDKVYMWIRAKLSGKMPIGTVQYYGSRDNDERIDRNNIFVKFVTKTDFGTIVDETYVEEKNLVLFKKSKVQRR